MLHRRDVEYRRVLCLGMFMSTPSDLFLQWSKPESLWMRSDRKIMTDASIHAIHAIRAIPHPTSMTESECQDPDPQPLLFEGRDCWRLTTPAQARVQGVFRST